jgi:hypothetical protein
MLTEHMDAAGRDVELDPLKRKDPWINSQTSPFPVRSEGRGAWARPRYVCWWVGGLVGGGVGGGVWAVRVRGWMGGLVYRLLCVCVCVWCLEVVRGWVAIYT